MKQIKILVFLCCFLPQLNYAQNLFQTTDEYLDITVKKTQFDRSKIVINDFINMEGFIDDVVSNELFTFYGIAYNDEIFSATQMEDKSCWGQFRDLFQSIKNGGK